MLTVEVAGADSRRVIFYLRRFSYEHLEGAASLAEWRRPRRSRRVASSRLVRAAWGATAVDGVVGAVGELPRWAG